MNGNGQQFLCPASGETGEVVYTLDANGAPLTGFDAGARFLDLRNGLAPDKLTAETRHVAVTSASGAASIAWSLSPAGPFRPLWHYPEKLQWRDGDPIGRLLLWPEVFRPVRHLPAGTQRVYVKFRSAGPALDSIRLAVYAEAPAPTGSLKLTQVWLENVVRREHAQQVGAATSSLQFALHAGPHVQNEAVILAAQ